MTRLVPGPQISGVVYSKQTGAPLAGVAVTPSAALYTTPEFTTPVSTLTTDGEGGFAAYAQPGVYTFTISDSSGVIPEPVEVRSPDQGTSPSATAAGMTAAIAAEVSRSNAAYEPMGVLQSKIARVPAALHAECATDLAALSNGTDIGGTYRVQHYLMVSGHDVVLGWSNFYNLGGVETDGPNAITLAGASIELADGTLIPVFFGGSRSVTIQPGATAFCDAVPIEVAQDTAIWTRSYVTVTSGNKWPNNAHWWSGGEASNRGASPTDLTLVAGTAGFVTSFETMFGPSAFYVKPYTQPKTTIATLGDSLFVGSGDWIPLTTAGWPYRWLGLATGWKYPIRRLAEYGSLVRDFAATTTRLRRMRLLDLPLTHVISDYPSINDVAGGRTVAQLQADSLTMWTTFHNRGVSVYSATIQPNTTSTDSWITTTNQTVATHEANRVGINNWLRAGAPIDPTTKAAVAIGTSGALLCSVWTNGTQVITGTGGHPCTGILDVAAVLESAVNSGFWAVPTQATIASASLTSNVVTLTTSAAHGIPSTSVIGASGTPFTAFPVILVSGVGAPFDGTYTVTGIPTGTTLTYAKTASNTTAGAGGFVAVTSTPDGIHPQRHDLIAAAMPSAAMLLGPTAS